MSFYRTALLKFKYLLLFLFIYSASSWCSFNQTCNNNGICIDVLDKDGMATDYKCECKGYTGKRCKTGKLVEINFTKLFRSFIKNRYVDYWGGAHL